MFKRYKKIIIPPEYGIIERKITLDDGSIHSENEKILLRQASEEYLNIQTKMQYETSSERVVVPERRYKRKDGTYQVFPETFKIISKQVVVGIDSLPPLTAVRTVKFLVRRDIRKRVLAELQSDYSEEQIKEFGLFGADIWYWKEVVLLVTTRAIKSDLGKALGRVFGKEV